MHTFDLSVTNQRLVRWAAVSGSSLYEVGSPSVHYSHRRYPVLRRDARTGERELIMMREGLIPSYAHDEFGAEDRADAHVESLNCASCFRSAFRRRRCIIPADLIHVSSQGRLEGSQACSLALESREIFGLAGIWETWCNDQGHAIQTFAVVSTTGVQGMPLGMNRMPVILATRDYESWLQVSTPDQAPLALLQPLAQNELHQWRLMPYVC